MVTRRKDVPSFFVRACIVSASMLALGASTAAAQQPGANPNAYTTTNVNQRAGPSTEYPVVVTVPERSYVTIHSCIRSFEWCDVSAQRSRGWMASSYLRGYTDGRYMEVSEFGQRVRLPVIAFEIGTYWPQYYRDRPFYPQMTRWTQPRRPVVTNNTFYRPLASYGSWVLLRGQYVWVPERVGPGWRPYTEGHWTYTRRYGWTWVSNEPFGWATYHYGRWGFSKRVGWFWVPGTRWAPAWVAWRGSDEYLAWAPLPPQRGSSISIDISIGDVPDYYWQGVPTSAFLSVNLSDRVIRDDRRYLRDTRPLGNVTIVNNVVVNNVVKVQYIEQKTAEKVIVHEIAATSNPDQAGKVEGKTLQVLTAASAPSAEPSATEAPPPEVRTIEQVAGKSQTKEQAGDLPATENLVTAPPPAAEPVAGEAAPVITGEPLLPTEPQLSAPSSESQAPPPEKPASPTESQAPPPEMPAPPTESQAPPPELPAPPAQTSPPEMPAPPTESQASPELPAPPVEIKPEGSAANAPKAKADEKAKPGQEDAKKDQVKPDAANEAKPDAKEAKPDAAKETKPDSKEAKPDAKEAKPDTKEVKPDQPKAADGDKPETDAPAKPEKAKGKGKGDQPKSKGEAQPATPKNPAQPQQPEQPAPANPAQPQGNAPTAPPQGAAPKPPQQAAPPAAQQQGNPAAQPKGPKGEQQPPAPQVGPQGQPAQPPQGEGPQPQAPQGSAALPAEQPPQPQGQGGGQNGGGGKGKGKPPKQKDQ